MSVSVQLVISEWGLGGGTQDGSAIAATLQDVAGHPFFGLWYPYSTSKDPWKNSSYNTYRYAVGTFQHARAKQVSTFVLSKGLHFGC